MIWSFISILFLTIMGFIYSINLTFPETKELQVFQKLKYLNLALYFLDLFLNSFTQKNEYKDQAVFFSDIMANYFDNGLVIDILSIILIPI